jgi:hypothetical protein
MNNPQHLIRSSDSFNSSYCNRAKERADVYNIVFNLTIVKIIVCRSRENPVKDWSKQKPVYLMGHFSAFQN